MDMPTIHNPPAVIPDVIRLPDGREFRTLDLLMRVRRLPRINLQTGTQQRPRGGAARYTQEEREFLAVARIRSIQERYQVTEEQAKRMRYNTRQFLGLPTRGQPGDPD